MIEIGDFVRKLKKKAVLQQRELHLPSRVWKEDDIFDDEVRKTMVIVLRTRGCSWNKCSICGYFRETSPNISQYDIIKQIDHALENYYDGEEIIKIFTSGSFLDDKEIKISTRDKILEKLSNLKDVKILSVESRPEFIDSEKLQRMKDKFQKKIEISIGLESANDTILRYSINKGFRFSDYLEKARIVREENLFLKTYLFLKPPFLSEKESIKDCISSIKKISRITDTISINPATIHKYTLLEYLWERNEYRPPWLWSVIEVLKEGKKIANNKRIKCDVVGGGTSRGAHNCEKCSMEVLKAIKKFSLDQNEEHFNNIYCDCKEEWKDVLYLESFSLGSVVRLYESC